MISKYELKEACEAFIRYPEPIRIMFAGRNIRPNVYSDMLPSPYDDRNLLSYWPNFYYDFMRFIKDKANNLLIQKAYWEALPKLESYKRYYYGEYIFKIGKFHPLLLFDDKELLSSVMKQYFITRGVRFDIIEPPDSWDEDEVATQGYARVLFVFPDYAEQVQFERPYPDITKFIIEVMECILSGILKPGLCNLSLISATPKQ